MLAYEGEQVARGVTESCVDIIVADANYGGRSPSSLSLGTAVYI